jgi:hypothetical protein
MKLNKELIDKLILENRSIVDDITKGNTKAINRLIGKIVSVDVSLGSMESKNYILSKLGLPIQIKKEPKVEEKVEVPKFEIESRMWKDLDGVLCMKSYYKVHGLGLKSLMKDEWEYHNFYSLDELKTFNKECVKRVVDIIESQFIKN